MTSSEQNKPDFSSVGSSAESSANITAKADFSDVSSQAQSTAPMAEQAQEQQSYTVRQGDTLSTIAKQHYGNSQAWPRIFDANRDVLSNPDHIKPGQQLKLPPASS